MKKKPRSHTKLVCAAFVICANQSQLVQNSVVVVAVMDSSRTIKMERRVTARTAAAQGKNPKHNNNIPFDTVDPAIRGSFLFRVTMI